MAAIRLTTSCSHKAKYDVQVTGTGNMLNAVISVLARSQIVAEQLRVEQANLEDAFLELISDRSAQMTEES